MVTGLDLSKLFEDKIDNSYSDYVSDAKMQRAFDNAFLRIIENKYRGMDTQKEFDELSELMVIDKRLLINNDRFRTVAVPIASVITGFVTEFNFAAEHNLTLGDTFTVSDTVGGTGLNGVEFTVNTIPSTTQVNTIITATSGSVTPNTGSVTTQHLSTDSMLPDYLHVLAIKSYMYDTSTDGYSPYKIEAGTPGVVEFFRPNKIRSGDYVHSVDLSAANPQQFIILKQISEFKYEIYDAADPTMNTPITVGVAPANPSDFVLRAVEENWAKYLQSDRRISKSGQPTIDEPRFNQHKNFILMHPQNATCPSVDVDYIRKPKVVIDVTDSVLDLNLFYSETLLNRLTDEAVKMFYQEVRDPNQYQIADREMIDNP
tara:strand:- start:842 stop:1960 length:1119 start_codon:yes stop_codon:yes gene_type:complete